MFSVVDNRIHLTSLSRKGFIEEKRKFAESSGSESNNLGWASSTGCQWHCCFSLIRRLQNRSDHPSSWLWAQAISALIRAGRMGTLCPLPAPHTTQLESHRGCHLISRAKITSRTHAVREAGLLTVQYLHIQEGGGICSKLAKPPNQEP